MRNNIDEIIRKFADILDKPPEIPIPDLPSLDWPARVTEEEIKSNEPIPVPNQKPLSQRDKPLAGSPEYLAEHHTQAFLLETAQPFRGWIRDPIYKDLVKKTMDKLVDTNPENYFEWKLGRREELQPWMLPAAQAWMKKNPVAVLMSNVWKHPRLIKFQTDLWNGVREQEINRSAFDPDSKGQIAPGAFFNKLRSLARAISVADPEFYKMFIEGKPVVTRKIDELANTMEKQLRDLGKIKDTLPHDPTHLKTKLKQFDPEKHKK